MSETATSDVLKNALEASYMVDPTDACNGINIAVEVNPKLPTMTEVMEPPAADPTAEEEISYRAADLLVDGDEDSTGEGGSESEADSMAETATPDVLKNALEAFYTVDPNDACSVTIVAVKENPKPPTMTEVTEAPLADPTAEEEMAEEGDVGENAFEGFGGNRRGFAEGVVE